jgi:hypothetical protein
MVAIALLLAKRSPSRLAVAGALCGLASLFTQSRGIVALAGFAAFLLWEWRTKKTGWSWLAKAEMYLVLPFLAIILPVMAYLAWKVGLRLFVNCAVVFLLKYWSKSFWGSIHVYGADIPEMSLWPGAPGLLLWLFMHLLLPFVYLWFFMQYRRHALTHPEEPWDRAMLLSVVGVFMFLGIISSPVWLRMISVAPPALILFVWLIKSPDKLGRTLTRLAWAGGLLALLSQTVAVQAGWKGYLDSPTGRAVLLDSDQYEKYRWVLEHTHPGDYYFQADDCDEYFLLALRNPAKVPFVTDSAYTRPEQVQNVIEMLEKHQVRFVMWSALLDVPRHPGDDGSARPLRGYIRAHYHPVREFEDQYAEVWERNQPAAAMGGTMMATPALIPPAAPRPGKIQGGLHGKP